MINAMHVHQPTGRCQPEQSFAPCDLLSLSMKLPCSFQNRFGPTPKLAHLADKRHTAAQGRKMRSWPNWLCRDKNTWCARLCGIQKDRAKAVSCSTLDFAEIIGLMSPDITLGRKPHFPWRWFHPCFHRANRELYGNLWEFGWFASF